MWQLIGSGVARQTSEAEVLGSNPASPTMILGRCRIIVSYYKTQGRGVNLHLRPKRDTKKTGTGTAQLMGFLYVNSQV